MSYFDRQFSLLLHTFHNNQRLEQFTRKLGMESLVYRYFKITIELHTDRRNSFIYISFQQNRIFMTIQLHKLQNETTSQDIIIPYSIEFNLIIRKYIKSICSKKIK